jgi:hypothetical protein
VYEVLFDAIAGMVEFRNRTYRVYPTESGKPLPAALPYIGMDTFEDFKYDEGGLAIQSAWQGKTDCGVAFVFKGREGETLAEEAKLIDAIEQAIRGIANASKVFDANGSGGGYTVSIDYVIPRGNDVASIDIGGNKVIEGTVIALEVGWTQTH